MQEGADGVAELQMKLEALQAQIQQMDAEKALTAKANSGPSVDRCSVHVAGISPVAVPEVIAAHFSMCSPCSPAALALESHGFLIPVEC